MSKTQKTRKKLTQKQEQDFRRTMIDHLNQKLQSCAQPPLSYSSSYADMRVKYDYLRTQDKSMLKNIFQAVAEKTSLNKTFAYKHFMNIAKNQLLNTTHKRDLDFSCFGTVTANTTPIESWVGTDPKQTEFDENQDISYEFPDLF